MNSIIQFPHPVYYNDKLYNGYLRIRLLSKFITLISLINLYQLNDGFIMHDEPFLIYQVDLILYGLNRH